MALTCPDCGADVTPGAKFCPECGVRQPDRPASSREVRKLVTVLFADVTGSTALGEQLDPEALRALMNRYFARMRSIIESHGGTVEKFIGDAVMAVFGIPQVHEDDALRAVRAAAEIRDALAAMNTELEAERGIAIRFRTGVNTGEVVAGDPDSGTTLVTGDTVNTAARLEQAAPPGEILLGKLTYSLVRDAVDAEPVDPVAAKGKAEPVEAYRLVAVRAGAEGRARHLDAPMVGRERELATLTDAWRKAVDERTPHLVTLVAPAGVGKSRLVREFIERVRDDGGRALVGRCLSYGEGITYWPVRELVHQAAGITEADGQARGLERIGELLEGVRDAPVLAAKVASIVGLSADPAGQEELFWAVRRLLEHLAEQQHTLVVLEDLHWAEDTLLDLVDYIVDLAADAPLLLLATTRPELLDRRAGFGSGRSSTTLVRLEPLGPDDAGAMLDALPGGTAIPPTLRTRILAASEGNPLYVEEYVGLLRDESHVVRDASGTWTSGAGIDHVGVPPTVLALLAARLEALPEAERRTAQRASVIGRTFEVAALADLDASGAPDLGRRLLALVRKELLRPDRAELTAGDAFRFRHVLIRDAAYDALPKAERAELHERFADWLEAAAGDRMTELEEILGYHLEESVRYRTELGEGGERLHALAERAGGRLRAAGRRADDLSDPRAARGLLERARRVLPPDSPLVVDTLLDLRRTYGILGEADAADDALAAAVSAVQPTAGLETHYRLRATLALGASQQAGGSVDELRRIAQEAIRVGEAAHDDAVVRHGLWAISWTYALVGQFAEERRILERLIAIDRAAGRHASAADSLATIANRIPFGPWTVPSAIADVEAMLPHVARHADPQASVLQSLGVLELLDGRPAQGRAHIAEAKRIADEVGLLVPAGSADWAMAIGISELLAGDPSTAVEPLRWAAEVLERAAQFSHLASVAPLLAQALLASGGDPREADALILRTREIAGADDLDAQCRWRLARAARLGAAGETVEAGRLVDELRGLLAGTEFELVKLEMEMTAVRLARQRGDGVAEAAARDAALVLARAKGSAVLEQRVLAL